MTEETNSRSILSFIVPFSFAFIGSKVVFRYFDFQYLIFSEPFNLVKLVIDLGVFVLFYFIGLFIYRIIFENNNV